ncbi:chemotaxis protein CheW [uncultured Desulfovibrio sp.]|uniref:chemotaxis protein CheW n=1 Tax=uncultured Desulfovibrio sp. TaxID=167968 RepID=UPI00263803AE|nr:chemotaxis protein CheW [uncultured Desulfovibrio sp.]
MVKTPAEYFADLDLHLSGKDAATAPLSRAEQSFVEKYLGPDALAGIPVITAPEPLMQGGAAVQPVAASPAPALVTASSAAERSFAAATEEAEPVDAVEDQRRLLFSASEIQLVSVRIAGTSFLLPIMAISEVLRHMPLALLPRAPRHVAGVINLRGRLTPLVHLCMLVSSDAAPRYNADSLVVVCPCGGIQIGLIIDKVENIYTVQQQELNWNPETHFGEAAECLYALARIGEHLYGILAPERIGQILCR